MIDLSLLATTYAVIFLAELPDKTAVASVVLATRHRPMPVFGGAALALGIQSLVAVGAGQLFSLLPARPVHLVAGAVFLVSAVLMWRQPADGEGDTPPTPSRWGAFGTSFAVVFAAEWGDLTQLGTAALAARYRAPLTIFVGSALALWSVLALAVLVGSGAARFLSPRRVRHVAAVAFAAIGLALVTGLL